MGFLPKTGAKRQVKGGQSDPPLSTGRTCGKPARKPAHCKRQVSHRRRRGNARRHGGGQGRLFRLLAGHKRAGFGSIAAGVAVKHPHERGPVVAGRWPLARSQSDQGE